MKTIGPSGRHELGKYGGYYRVINEGVKKALGGLHSATFVLYSVDFIGMLVDQKNIEIRLFDTMAIHAQKAVQYAIMP
jgi:aspartate racemase